MSTAVFSVLGMAEIEEIYMGSADWMPRNLDRRVEITFPVLDPSVRAKVRHILEVELEDTVRARIMKMDESGQYERIDREEKCLLTLKKCSVMRQRSRL